MSEKKVSMWGTPTEHPFAVWSIALDALDIERLAAGISPMLVQPEHLVICYPNATSAGEASDE